MEACFQTDVIVQVLEQPGFGVWVYETLPWPAADFEDLDPLAPRDGCYTAERPRDRTAAHVPLLDSSSGGTGLPKHFPVAYGFSCMGFVRLMCLVPHARSLPKKSVDAGLFKVAVWIWFLVSVCAHNLLGPARLNCAAATSYSLL